MIKVWDLFVRLSHWLIVILVISAWLSANYGDAEFKWHSWNGYALFILLITRIIWGIVGSTSARFSHFIKSPYNVLAYLSDLTRGKEAAYLGHNPAGAWMVVILLAGLFLQVVTGLFSSDDIIAEGPFSFFLSGKNVSLMTGLHHLGFDILMILVVVHVLAVIYHQFFKRENLIGAMLTGKKIVRKNEVGEVLYFKSFYFALIILAVVAFVFWGVLAYYI